MKICLVHEEYPEETNFGGIATYQKRLALALKNRGHEITVITRALNGGREYVEDGINIIRINKNDTDNKVKDYEEYRLKVKKIITKLVEDKKVEVLEVPDWGAEAIFYQRERKVPMVVKLHTPLCVWAEFNKNGLGEGIQEKMLEWEDEAIKTADHVISCTQILKDLVLDKMDLEESKIEVVPNPGNIADFYPMAPFHQSKTILYCGSTEQRKGVDVLAKAIPLVMEKLNDQEIKFIFIGKDTTRNEKGISTIEFIKNIVPLKFHGNIEFLGQLPNGDLNVHYNNARIGIVPSKFDNLPYVAMEQLLTEMPLVASDNTGVREMMVNNESGLLFKNEDHIDLANKIIFLYENPAIAKKYGENARVRMLELYAPDRIAKIMEKIYGDLIDNNNR